MIIQVRKCGSIGVVVSVTGYRWMKTGVDKPEHLSEPEHKAMPIILLPVPEAACVIVTGTGLPEAPLAVTWIVPECCVPVFWSYETMIVPLFPPDAPDEM